MRRHRVLCAWLLVAGCTNGDGAERPPEVDVRAVGAVPVLEASHAPTPKTWGWATRTSADSDRVLGLAVAGDGSTVLLAGEGLGWRGDDVALSRYDVEGKEVFSRPLALRSGPEGRALALRGDRIEVLDLAMPEHVPALKVAIHALDDGRWLEDRAWEASGDFRPNELHVVEGGDTIVAGYAISMTAGPYVIGRRDDRPQAFIARFAPDGSTKWLASLSGADAPWHSRSVAAVSVTPTAIFMTGGCEGRSFGRGARRIHCAAHEDNAYVARWSLDGELEWLDAIEGGERGELSPELEPRGMAATLDGGILVIGRFSGQLRAGHGEHRVTFTSKGGSDAFLTHYDRTGELVGAWSVGDAGLDRFTDIAVDSDGDAWIAGIVYGHDALAIDLSTLAKPKPRNSPKPSDPLPRFGVLVRVDLDRKAAASLPGRFVAAQGELTGPGDGVTPERVVVAGDHVRVAGAYGGQVELPILDGSVASLELRDPAGIDDEVFVWASARRMPAR
jgi:hypothetical protein